MIRFVGTDAAGLPLKRKQSRRACERCRERKKRCPHQFPIGTPGLRANHVGEVLSPSSTAVPRTESPARSLSAHARQPRPHSSSSTGLPSSRTPVSVIADGNNTAGLDYDDDSEDQNPRFVGELNPEGIFVAGVSPDVAPPAVATSSSEDTVGIWVPRKLVNAVRATPGPMMPLLLLPNLEDECSRALPPTSHYDVLHRLYAEEFHPILPVINLESFDKVHERSRTLLKLAVCLSVSSNPRAAVHLSQSPKVFVAQTIQLLRSAIDNGLARDRQVIMQLFIVLALSTQLSDDRHASSEFTSRAITYAQTGGLQLDTSANPGNHVHFTRLFCCVFTLDRLNATVQGRPILMHERDFGRDMDVCIGQQNGLFQLLLRVILVLDKVIALYRPPQSSRAAAAAEDGPEDIIWNFPTFEDLLNSCGTLRAPAKLVATVETLYHAVTMLSCRSQSLDEPLRSSVSRTRQDLSAASVVSIVSNEYHEKLSVFSFVPYAVSLALRVYYRDLRLSKSAFMRARARRQLLHVCALLRELGGMFVSSLQMAELAEQTVREMDKAYSTVAEQRRASVASEAPGAGRSEAHHALSDEGRTVGTELRDPLTRAPDKLVDVGLSDSVHDSNGDRHTPAVDPAWLDVDFNIFDYFDPAFDIHAIDAALANSIDPSFPVNLAYFDSFDR